MARTVELNVDINVDDKSLGGLKKEIQDIQAQLDFTPTGTKEYDALVVRLREAKGEIKDFKEATKGLDPDQRAAKLVNAFQGMTGAIQASAGALTLFGVNADNLEKVEKNLLGIIAIGGGIQQTIAGYNDVIDVVGPKLKNLGNTITTAFTTGTASARAFNVALTGLGIGVVILAVNELSKAFEDNKKAQEDAAAEAELSLKRVDNAERKKLAAIIDNNKKQLRSDLETARERGASDLELVQIKLDSQKALTKAFDEFRNESNTQTAAFIDEQNKLALASADAEIEIGNELNEVKRKQREADIANAKALAKEKSDFLLGIENDLREALQQLAIDQAATERERAQIEYNNTLEDFRIAKNAELAEAERLGVSSVNIIAKYAALEKDTKIKLNNDLATIDKAASEKLISERRQQLENQLSLVEAQYSRTLNNIENTATQIALTQNVATKEQFDEIYGFIAQAINDTKAALEKENLDIASSIRNRVNITVALLEEEQLKRQKILGQQTDDAIKNNGIFSAEAVAAQNKQAADFQAFQDRKLQIITNGSKALLAVDNSTTEKQVQNQQQLQDLVLGSAKSLFGDLSALNLIFASDNEAAAEKAFNQQKNFATATALIDTYLAAQKAFTSQIIPGDASSLFRAQIAAGIAIATGLARVAVIRAQKYDNPTSGGGAGGGGSVGGGSGLGGGGNIFGEFSGNVLPPRLAQTRDPNQVDVGRPTDQTAAGIPIVRAYVLSGDVTDAQTAEIKLNQKRKF